ncbi:MAG: hypothetical protein Q9N02_06365 [Ghiorsea sp.]|nr:hypothetical protein [Ghiorsea sp.]
MFFTASQGQGFYLFFVKPLPLFKEGEAEASLPRLKTAHISVSCDELRPKEEVCGAERQGACPLQFK